MLKIELGGADILVSVYYIVKNQNVHRFSRFTIFLQEFWM